MNSRIFSSLQLNITNVKDMILIDKCVNSTNEEGNFFDSWKILVNKYEPKNSVIKNKIMSEFHNIKQDPNDTCIEYLHKVEDIKSKLEFNFNYKIDEIILVNKVINDLFMRNVDDAKFKIKFQELNLDIVGLEKELSQHDTYKESLNDIMSKLDNSYIENNCSELSSTSFKKLKNVDNSSYNNNKSKKDLICNNCGKKGHKTELCWSDLKCPYCNEIGHPEILCLNKICDYCGKRKHLKPQCPLLKNNIKNNNYNLKCSNNVNYNCSSSNENQIINDNYDSNKNKTDSINIKHNSNIINFNSYVKSFDIVSNNENKLVNESNYSHDNIQINKSNENNTFTKELNYHNESDISHCSNNNIIINCK